MEKSIADNPAYAPANIRRIIRTYIDGTEAMPWDVWPLLSDAQRLAYCVGFMEGQV